ncbi:uncharacterized protein FA14DRAFT_166841 [Meira miltonrushii]|uniref:Cytoplasmic protein n=1 Tax=Meira miltonrushii TaxID=1280837 RepID=A0A316VJH7_9BASI|nr:uncharacterized protein FA14DRAFT_166841 [Meira miltonrushii]PWN37837.1 hypothetical protein FA14DRAFT_166841 [Meira miltonrushii]
MSGAVNSPQTAAPLVPNLLPGGFHRFRPVSDADDFPNEETNLARPLTDSVITIRIIKSFAYRSMKALVLQHVDITKMTVDQLRSHCQQEVRTNSVFKAFRSFADKLDTLKIYTRAHGAKTTNLIINLDRPDWILEDGTKTLLELGLENEAELSLFNRADYEEFIQNPETKW